MTITTTTAITGAGALRAALFATALFVLFAAAPVWAQAAQGPSAAATRVAGALFLVQTSDGEGSAFQYRHRGYVLTNRHVVDTCAVGGTVTLRAVRTAADGSVGLGDGFEGTVRFKHPTLDVAVIEIPTTVANATLQPVTTPGGKHVARGVELFAHGFPGVVGAPTISRGILSAHRVDPATGETFYLTDTSLSPGSSGGPVTDGGGGVIGIATAVSIVGDGVGSSWGYVLPIRTVDAALQTRAGLRALPEACSVTADVDAIRSASSADQAMQAYAVGVDDAARRCTTLATFSAEIARLASAVRTASTALRSDRLSAFDASRRRASVATVRRRIEFYLLDDKDEAGVSSAKAQADVTAWVGTVATRLVEASAEKDRPEVLTLILSATTWGVVDQRKNAPAACAALRVGQSGLPTASAPARMHRFADAVASLAQLRTDLQSIDASAWNADDPQFPPSAQSAIRMSIKALGSTTEIWDALPEPCRKMAEAVTVNPASDDDDDDEPAAPAAPPQREPPPLAPSRYGTFDARLQLWRQSGFQQWGEVQDGVTYDGRTSYGVSFDEAPAMVWVGLRAADAEQVSLRVSDKDSVLTPTGEVTQGDIAWTAFEVATNARVTLAVVAGDGAARRFELVVLHRHSPLRTMRERFATQLPNYREAAHRSYVLNGGEHEDFAFNATSWRAFRLLAFDMAKNDIDLALFDDGGRQISVDDAEDSFPAVGIEAAQPARYHVRLTNTSKNLAFVEAIVFGVPR